MDSAYDAVDIRAAQTHALGQVPLIDNNPRLSAERKQELRREATARRAIRYQYPESPTIPRTLHGGKSERPHQGQSSVGAIFACTESGRPTGHLLCRIRHSEMPTTGLGQRLQPTALNSRFFCCHCRHNHSDLRTPNSASSGLNLPNLTQMGRDCSMALSLMPADLRAGRAASSPRIMAE